MTPTPDLSSLPANVPSYLVGILVAAVVALAGVVAYLFKHYSVKVTAADDARARQAQECALERQQWAVERQKYDEQRDDLETKLRLEYETKHRVILEHHIKMMADLHEAARVHDNEARREFAELMSTVADKAQESQEKLAGVMEKFYARYVGPRSRGGKD